MCMLLSVLDSGCAARVCDQNRKKFLIELVIGFVIVALLIVLATSMKNHI
jgi:hypothetical protein